MTKRKKTEQKVKNKRSYLPQGWQETPLWEVCETPVSGYSPVGKDRPAKGDEVGVLKLNCIQGGRFNPEKNKAVKGTKINELKTPVRKNTLIISRSNTEDLVGAVCYVDNDFPNLFLSDLLWQITPKDNARVDLKWLSYLLAFAPYRAKIIARANGTSETMKKINRAGFLGIRVTCPNVNEQKIIAKIISTWDAAIDQTRKLITAKKNHKKALMRQMLEPKVEWIECYLNDVAKINSKSLSESTDPNFQFVYIDIASVSDRMVKENGKLIQFSEAPSRARRLLSEGDIIMSTVRPNLKNYAYIDFNCSQYVCSTGFAVIAPKENSRRSISG